jgi:hypothetical protein
MKLTRSRQHPVVYTQADKVFLYVAQALEAATLTGQTASRVCEATKVLLASTNTNVDAILASFPPEAQDTVRRHFG